MNNEQINELAIEIADDVIDKYLDVTDFEAEMDVTEFTDETLNLFIIKLSKEFGDRVLELVQTARESEID